MAQLQSQPHPMHLRERNTNWPILPAFHGYSNDELIEKYSPLPSFGDPWLDRNWNWRITVTFPNKRSTKSANALYLLLKYQGYFTTQMNMIATH